MIEVAQIIERLLLQNDCVIVPGLGGFVAQDCEACYVKEENIFLPPYRSVNFNPRLTMNDGLFINEFAKLNGLSYSEAMSAVSCKITFIRQQIVKHGKFNISGVGSLKATASGNYEFTPLVCGIDSPEHYALDSFYIPTIRDNAKSVPAVEVSTKEEKTVTVNIRKNVIRYAAAVAVAVAVFFFCLVPFSSSFHTTPSQANVFESMCSILTATSNSEPSEVVENNSNAKAISKENSSNSANTALKSSSSTLESTNKANGENKSAGKNNTAARTSITATGTSEASAENNIQDSPRPYTLILASAIPQEGAERMVENLKRKGLKEARVVNDRNMLRVVYGRYANAAEAAQALREGRALNHAFDHAWILTIE